MFLRRHTFVVFIFALALSLTACTSEGLRLPVTPIAVTPSAAEPLQAGSTAVAQQEGSLSTSRSPLATPADIAPAVATPGAEQAAVAGRLIRFATSQPIANQNLSLPALLCPPDVAEEDKREECVYVIDEAFDPSVLTDEEGRFVFRDIAAGEYVLMIGNPMTQYIVLSDEFNQPLIWKVEPGRMLELGDLVVDIP